MRTLQNVLLKKKSQHVEGSVGQHLAAWQDEDAPVVLGWRGH